MKWIWTQTKTRKPNIRDLLIEPGIEPDPEKIGVIKIWAIPTNRKGVKSFLGAVDFYRRCVKDFAKIAIPLTELLKKDSTLIWRIAKWQHSWH